MADPTADLSRGPVLVSTSLATASLALATTFVRFYVRRRLNDGSGPDGPVSGAAAVMALIGTIFAVIEGNASDPTRALEFNVIGQPWCLLSAMISKISICLVFMSLSTVARQWRILLAGLVLVTAVINLAYVLALYLRCLPLAKVWDPSVAGSCSDPTVQTNIGYTQGTSSVLLWAFVILFPVLVVRDISRGGQPTWPLYTTSVLSFASAIFVIIRTAQIPQTTGTGIYTTHFVDVSLMANLEQNISLISSNILALGSLVSLPATTTTTSSSHRSRNRHRWDPYGSSSASTSRSRRSGKSKRTATSAPSRASSSRSIARPDTRASSRASSRHLGGNGSTVGGSGETDRGRTPHPIIGEPGLGSNREGGGGGEADLGDPGYRLRYDHRERERGESEGAYAGFSDGGDNSDDGEDYEGDGIDLEAWPRGIIKTVTVEVVEEVNEEYVATAAAAAKNNNAGAGVGAGAAVGVVAGGSNTKGVGGNSVMVGPGVVGFLTAKDGCGW